MELASKKCTLAQTYPGCGVTVQLLREVSFLFHALLDF